MSQQQMYAPMNNSPITLLTSAITAAATTIVLDNAAVVPAAPCLAVIGAGDDAEIIKYTDKSGNTLTGVTRGINGTTAKSWSAGTIVARNFTSFDQKLIQDNIEDLDNRMRTEYYTRPETDAALAAEEITGTAAGSAVSVDDAVEAPVSNLIVDVAFIQTGSGNPSPSNVRPISGRTEMTLTYNGTARLISWAEEAGTVYGAKINVISGRMTVDRRMSVFDGSSDESWRIQNTGGSHWYYRLPYGVREADLGKASEIRTNLYPQANIINSNEEQGCGISSGDVRVRWGSEGTVDSWRAALSAQPLQVAYYLADTIDIQLDPISLHTILGTNTCSADCGDILSLDYYNAAGKAVAEAIDTAEVNAMFTGAKMITDSVEARMTAGRNYTTGDLIIVNNKLLRATANIAAGADLVIGSNVETTTLERILSEISQ